MVKNMNLVKILFGVMVVSIIGCAGTPESRVKDVDPVEKEMDRLKAGAMLYEDTPPFMMIASKRGTEIYAVKQNRTFQTNDPGVRQARWKIMIENHRPYGRCVAVRFRLLDFDYISNHPQDFHVPPHGAVLAGVMQQKVWEINGVKFVPPSSGYVTALRLQDPVIDADPGEECDFAVEDAVEKEDAVQTSFSLF